MALASFHLDVDELGHGTAKINGVDIAAQIAELQVLTRPGQPTIVAVRQAAGATRLTGTGIVHVHAASDEPIDEGTLVADWIAQLDPAVVEQHVLALFAGVDPPATNGEAWIRAIQHLARPDA